MLIAIMGNTFDKVMDKRSLSSLRERIAMMQDYRKVVTFLGLDKSYKFMIILKPSSLSDIGEESWDGKVTAIKQVVTDNQEKAEEAHNKRQHRIESRIQSIDSNFNSRVDKLEYSVKENKATISCLNDDVKSMNKSL